MKSRPNSTTPHSAPEGGKERTMETCDRCHGEITSQEAEKGWPLCSLEGDYICPSCYGAEAFCACGEILSADSDTSLCPLCDRKEVR